MNSNNFIKILIAIPIIVFIISCNDDTSPPPPIIPNEEELITTLNYTLISQSGDDTVVLSFQDLDGDGGNAPKVSTGELLRNTSYNGSITLLNEQESPAENITLEIEEEALEHQFFFSSNSDSLSMQYADQDSLGNPIGLLSTLMTKGPDATKINIILRHEPNKKGLGVSDGDITNAGGETDIEVSFDITIK